MICPDPSWLGSRVDHVEPYLIESNPRGKPFEEGQLTLDSLVVVRFGLCRLHGGLNGSVATFIGIRIVFQ